MSLPLGPQASSLQYEMLLLTDSISKEDSCWELRLRCGEFGGCLVGSRLARGAQLAVGHVRPGELPSGVRAAAGEARL